MSHTVDRRTFNQAWITAILGGATITISCGGGSPTAPPPPPPPTPTATPEPTATPTTGGSADVQGDVAANHGHKAVITGAELDAGMAMSINIMGTADHTHAVNLTAAQVVSVREGNTVSIETGTTQFHTHIVTFN
jgi:hypothetical protein